MPSVLNLPQSLLDPQILSLTCHMSWMKVLKSDSHLPRVMVERGDIYVKEFREATL